MEPRTFTLLASYSGKRVIIIIIKISFRFRAAAKHLERVVFLLLGHEFPNSMTGP
jgi:hypothetical protein